MKENMSCRLCLLITIDDEETFLRKAPDIIGKEKAKEIAKNLLEIGLTPEQVALTTGLSLKGIKKL